MKGKGQVMLLGFMLGIIILVFILAVAGTIKGFTERARNQSSEFGGMDCNNESISNFDKAACLSTDLSLPLFVLVVVGLAGVYVTAKIMFS